MTPSHKVVMYKPLRPFVEAMNKAWYESHGQPVKALAPPISRGVLDKMNICLPDSLYRYLTLVSEDIVIYSPCRFQPNLVFTCNGRSYLIIANGGEAIDLTDDELGGRICKYGIGKSGYIIISQLDKTFYNRIIRYLFRKDMY